jgi:hypothetical protein
VKNASVVKESAYYAGGSKVKLHRTKRFGYLRNAARLKMPPNSVVARLDKGSLIVDLDKVPAAMCREWEKSALLQPVFEFDGARVVVLPELRVEDTDMAKINGVEAFRSASADAFSFEKNGDEMGTVRPDDADADTTLRLARTLKEKLGLQSVTPRLIRLLPGKIKR